MIKIIKTFEIDTADGVFQLTEDELLKLREEIEKILADNEIKYRKIF